MMRDNKDTTPLFLRLGMALALSFAGFLYSQFRPRRIRAPTSPNSSSYSGHGNKVDSNEKGGFEDDLRDTQTKPCFFNDASVTVQNCEESSHQKLITDNSVSGISQSSKHSGEGEGFLLPELNEILLEELELMANNSPWKDVETTIEFRIAAEKEMEQEIIHLRNMVQFLQDRKRDLENQLIEYYGLREQETSMNELLNRLKINSMEAKLLNLKIESLQAENRRLKAQLGDYPTVMAELESAREKIKLLQRNIRSDAQQNKEQLSILKERVLNLQDQEQMATMNDVEVEKKLQSLKDLENELAELKRTNLKLHHENSELSMRLESTQILASSVLEDPQSEALHESNDRLRKENEDLTKKIEELQVDRYGDLEELVYLRWINACLRYELRNYQPPPGKTVARDLSKTLSPKSEEKAKKLILEYASSDGIGVKDISLIDFDSGYWSSSQGSYSDTEDSSTCISSSTRINSKTKTKFFSKLKRLVLGKSKKVESAEKYESHAASGSRLSISATSFEEVEGQHNSSIHVVEGEAKTGQMNKINLPQSSYIPSLNTQRLRHLSMEDIRGIEKVRRNSDVGSSYVNKGMITEENELNHSPNTPEKLDLMKYAEALKGSHGSPRSHRKSASYSYL